MKIRNIKAIAFIKNLEKAYTEGVYSDTPANRKLGRVGMSYKEWTSKQQGQQAVATGGGNGNDGDNRKLGRIGKEYGKEEKKDWRNGIDKDSIEEIEQLIQAYHRQGYDDENFYHKTLSHISDIVGSDIAENILKQEKINPPKEKKVRKKKNIEVVNSSSKNSQFLNNYLNEAIGAISNPKDVRGILNNLKNHISIDEDGIFHLKYTNDFSKKENSVSDLIIEFYNKFEHDYNYEKEKFEKACELVGVLKILDGNNINNINIENLLKSDTIKNFKNFIESTARDISNEGKKIGNSTKYYNPVHTEDFEEKTNEEIKNLKESFYRSNKNPFKII